MFLKDCLGLIQPCWAFCYFWPMTKARNLLRLNFSAFNSAWFLNYAYTQLREGWVITGWKKDILYFMIDWLSGGADMVSTTSGSTGNPKTITINKEFVKKSANTTCDFFDLKKGDVALLCLPVKYIAGKLMVVRAMERHLNLYCVEPSLTPDFEETHIDFAAMTPAQVASLLETEKGLKLLERIKILIIGGDAIPGSLEAKLQALPTQIWHTYGMTETITHIALRSVNGKRPSSAFTSLPGVTVSLAEDESLVIDAPEIGVRSMKTNDIAEINKDGSFFIKGRKDNVLISGGIKIFPEQVERSVATVCKHPFYITGVDDEKLGTKLVMVVEGDKDIDTAQLLTEIRKVVDRYRVPKQIVVQPTLKRTGSGKIIRQPLF